MRNCLLLSGTITASIPFFSESKHPPHPHFPAIWDQAPVLPTTSPAEGLFCTTNPSAHLSPIQNVTDIPGEQREGNWEEVTSVIQADVVLNVFTTTQRGRQAVLRSAHRTPSCLPPDKDQAQAITLWFSPRQTSAH